MQYFSPDALVFLRQLANNNNVEWFHANKERYERLIRRPCLVLLADLEPILASIKPGYEVDRRKTGGSLFRIQRNTRFTADRRPYREWQGARFLQQGTTVDMTAELSLRIGPDGQSEVGAGLMYPTAQNLQNIREAICEEPTQWQAIEARVIQAGARFVGPSLTRLPRGFEPSPDCVAAIKRKACAVVFRLEDEDVCSSNLVDIVRGYLLQVEEFSEWISYRLASERRPAFLD